jgi:general secretion pathway protein K
MAARRSARFLSEILRTSLAEPRRSRGFALLLVLWVLVLIAFLVAQVTAAGRTELRIAGNLYANAAAEAALEGAVNEAVFHLSDPQPGRRWAFDPPAIRTDDRT